MAVLAEAKTSPMRRVTFLFIAREVTLDAAGAIDLVAKVSGHPRAESKRRTIQLKPRALAPNSSLFQPEIWHESISGVAEIRKNLHTPCILP